MFIIYVHNLLFYLNLRFRNLVEVLYQNAIAELERGGREVCVIRPTIYMHLRGYYIVTNMQSIYNFTDGAHPRMFGRFLQNDSMPSLQRTAGQQSL